MPATRTIFPTPILDAERVLGYHTVYALRRVS